MLGTCKQPVQAPWLVIAKTLNMVEGLEEEQFLKANPDLIFLYLADVSMILEGKELWDQEMAVPEGKDEVLSMPKPLEEPLALSLLHWAVLLRGRSRSFPPQIISIDNIQGASFCVRVITATTQTHTSNQSSHLLGSSYPASLSERTCIAVRFLHIAWSIFSTTRS
ncbi:hypothetical protein L7F22_048047 [Adiantum nelumboides]|nr:hypothetical protein [Adiantum nelumboides]